MARVKAAQQVEQPQTPVAEVQPEAPKDIPPKADGPPVELRPAFKDRAAVLREISQRNRDERDEALRSEGHEPENTRADEDEEREDDDEKAEVKADEKEESTATASEGEASDSAAPAPGEPATRKFVVDGKEVAFNDEQIAAIVQKHASADSRLVEATRLLNEARQKAVTSLPGDSQRAPSAAPPAADVREVPSVDVDQLTAALMYGKEEEVKGALSSLVTAIGRQRGGDVADRLATQTQGMAPEQVRAYVKETIAFENALSKLDLPPEQGGFADVWSDPVLKSRFVQRESEIANELNQAGQRSTYLDIYTRVAKEIRDWRDGLIQQHAPKTGLEDRGELKRQAGVVRGAGGKQPTAPQESQPLTHEDKLEKMRKARGQS